jgi:hypothetical protein
MLQLLCGKWVSQSIYAAAELGVADQLAAGPRTGNELAAALEVNAQALHRLLRMLVGFGVFTTDAQGRFALTPLGQTLQSDSPGSMRAMARYMGMSPSWRAWEAVVYSVRTGKSAFVHQHGMAGFEYLQNHPAEAAIFNEAMTNLSAGAIPALLAAYDFSRFPRIVDVGGGHGHLLAELLGTNPTARGVLFDLPHATEGARGFLENAGLTARTDVIAGDFFQSLPAGPGAYILKHVIHDWDDDRSKAILETCRRAMEPSGTLLVIEMVIPPGNEPSFGKLLDMEMLVTAPGGRERTEAEYRALFAAAGFSLTHTVAAAPTPFSILEATPT